MDIPAAMHQRLKPLADYLGRELGRPVSLRLSRDFLKAVDQLAEGSIDIAYLSPIAYVNARRLANARILAGVVTRGKPTFQLMLITRQESPIHTVSDLAGRSFAFGDEAALLQRAVLANAGMQPERLGSYRFLGHFDNVARGVANGDFDAGILKDTAAFQWAGKGLRVFHASPELPPYNIVVSSRMDDALARNIQAALLRLQTATPEHRAIIKALDENYDGFAPASDADYDVVRRLARPFLK